MALYIHHEVCVRLTLLITTGILGMDDHLVFIIKNQVQNISMDNLQKFFEKGYSTKSREGDRGLGLYNAKALIERYKGTITVSQDKEQEQNYLTIMVNI